MNLTEYYKFRALMGNISGGGGGSDDDSVVIIYDGNIEVSLDDNYYIGAFTPTNEIGTGSIVIELNETKYTTAPAKSNPPHTWWEAEVDGAYLVVEVDDHNVYTVYAAPDFLLSGDDPQTVTVKITQDQSGSGDGEFSTANVSIHNGTNEMLTVGIPFVNEENIGCAVELCPSEVDEEYTVPLYKGMATIIILYGDYSAVVTGSIYNDPQFMKYQFQITGDGTIFITDTDPDHGEVEV